MSTKDNCGKDAICCFCNLSAVLKHWNLSVTTSEKARRKANFGCTPERPQLLFFSLQTTDRRQSTTKQGSAEAADVRKGPSDKSLWWTKEPLNTQNLSLCKFPPLPYNITWSPSKSNNLETRKKNTKKSWTLELRDTWREFFLKITKERRTWDSRHLQKKKKTADRHKKKQETNRDKSRKLTSFFTSRFVSATTVLQCYTGIIERL